MPELFEIIVHTGSDIESLPPPTDPYYVLASEGMFLHKKTQIGNVLVRQTKTPPTLGKIGFANGIFTWEGEVIPGKIIAQATDFFRRVYDKHKTEAEVIITMHNETGAFRLFVPHQRVNGAGVKSIYEPTHIDRNYTVVGTLHSHCHFSAFHSATDSGDASDMDGVHFTIGMLQNEPPQIVAMVAMNGKEFHYKDPSDIAEIVFTGHTAPPWWDDYVFPGETQTEKPKSLKSLTQEQWNEFRGLALSRPAITHHTSLLPIQRGVYSYSGYEMGEDEEFNYRQWGVQPRRNWTTPTPPVSIKKLTKQERKAARRAGRYPNPVWGSDGTLMGPRTAEAIIIDAALEYGIDGNVFHNDEWSEIRAADMDEISYWATYFSDKMTIIADMLNSFGYEVEYNIRPKKTEDPEETPEPKYTQLPGQITVEEALKDKE